MANSKTFDMHDIYTISGTQISEIYEKNKMTVHFQGMSKCLEFPHTVALQGAPTCSIGISPYGLYNRFNDAGRLIMLNQKTLQFGSAPYISTYEGETLLTQLPPGENESDDIPAMKNYYPEAVEKENIKMTMATPSLEIEYTLEDVKIIRRMISPLLSGAEHFLMPISVEEFTVENNTDEEQDYTLVIPRPSLINLQEKELKPTDQDSIFTSSAAVYGHKHEAFEKDGIQGVVMGSTATENKMAIAVANVPGVAVDTQPYFLLNKYSGDLLITEEGNFYEKNEPAHRSDYGAAVSLTMTLQPGESKTIPFAVVLDFPVQEYNDGKSYNRKYIQNFDNAETRTMDMVKIAIESYPQWWDATLTVQERIFNSIYSTPSYEDDYEGAMRLTRLMLNELHFPLSNACIWSDEDGKEQARFLECFDYSYIDPSDVDWYSMVLLMLYPKVEKNLCQAFINSINAVDSTPRWYHQHASFVEARMHFEENPEEYKDQKMTQIRDDFKTLGSVAHDVCMLSKGHPLRNVSDYAWYNNNYWVDLYPKLMMRVLRNVKFTGDMEFLESNWETMKFGLESLLKLDFDNDGIPEGNPDDVKNTFDNLVLFGADAYDATQFLGGCQALIKMAQMLGKKEDEEHIQKIYDKAWNSFDQLWRETENKKGEKLEYYVTCFDPETGNTNTDVWTNQLDALWYLLAIGEEPAIPEDRVKKILRTIYDTNRAFMGWAMCKTEDGGEVESDQGKDVYTTSNYVFAQLLEYYGMVEESKDVYKHMDRVVFDYANTLTTPDNLRAELELEHGEDKPGPHYIVAAYPRPGAVWTHLALNHVKAMQQKNNSMTVGSEDLTSFFPNLIKATEE